MYKILEGVLNSSIAPELKRAVFKKIEASGSLPHQEDEVSRILSVCFPLFSRKESEPLLAVAAVGVFTAWSRANPSVADTCLATLLSSTFKDRGETHFDVDIESICDLLDVFLSLRHDVVTSSATYCYMQSHGTLQLISQANTVKDVAEIAQLIFRKPPLVSVDISSLLSLIIKQLAFKDDLKSYSEHVKQYIHHCSTVAKLIRMLWQSSGDHQKNCILFSLQTVFDVISRDTSTPVSIGLSTVLQSVPAVMIDGTCRNLVNDRQVTDEQLKLALSRMMEWLAWPKHQTLHTWINTISIELVKAGKQIILYEVTDHCLSSVIQKLQYHAIQKSSLEVVQTLLLLHQNCAQVFLKVVAELLSAFSWLTTEDLRSHLADLLQVLMYMHPGHPEVYNSLIEPLSGYPPLADADMQAIVNKYNVGPAIQQIAAHVRSSVNAMVRSPEAFVGLENLGNTCFANSVLQALYNTDAFRDHLVCMDVVTPKFSRQLQILFALLKLSHRAVVKPSEFMTIVFPGWFQMGSQQDSSEYLRFLLDGIHDQHSATASSSDTITDPSSIFTGSWVTTVQCHGCNSSTQRPEKFYDVPLHFMNTAGSSQKSLSINLMDMIEQAMQPEQMCGDNQFYCDNCATLQDATKSVSDFSPPASLTFTLCRFSYDLKLGKRTKVKTPVCFPDRLILNDRQYQLNAVVVHSGSSLDGGHYYTYARSSLSSDNWYLYNDDRVTACSSPVDMSSKSGASRLSLDTPYIIIYSCQLDGFKPGDVSMSLQSLVIKDNLLAARQWKEESEKRSKYQSACRPCQSWYSDDNGDDGDQGPHADKSLDLSGSRFIF